jgi:L(+)-tartrate dehydratase alpha subunit
VLEAAEVIKKELLGRAIFETIKRGACQIPPDVRSAIEQAIEQEKQPVSKRALKDTLRSLDRCGKQESPACGDTGWPLFFFKVGNEAKLEGGFLALEGVSRRAVEQATAEGFLRKTMKHPLTGVDPGTNLGLNMPGFTYQFVPGDAVQITFVPKGGGGELFGGSRYTVLAYSDGSKGIEKFVIDSYIDGARAGAICPPSIVGVGIGGTFEISARLAKEAAVLRVIGSHHSDPQMATMERDLFEAINELRIGTMGSGGDISVLAVHVEYAYTHIGGIMVSMNTNCLMTRRVTIRICSDGRIQELENPLWFDGR